MKIIPLLLAVTFLGGLFPSQAKAEDPAPIALTPEMQALLAELMKTTDADPAPGPKLEPEAHVDAPAAPTAAASKPPLGSASNLRTGSLATGSLSGGRLAPSSKSDRRGAGIARLSASAWRLLFPR